MAEITTDNIITDLNNKADRDLLNLSADGLAKLGGGSSRNIGEIIASALPITSDEVHLLDGALIQGDGIYADFVEYISNLDLSANYFCTEIQWQQSITDYGVCGKFVYDSVNNTVRLPKITGIIEGTTDVTALGDLVEAGLPNITGNVKTDGSYGFDAFGSTSGAFTRDTTIGWQTNTLQSTQPKGSSLDFDASRSSSLYKNNFNRVQPQTIKVLYYIVIATSTKTEVQVDIDNIATDLNGKVNISDLVEVQCIVKTYHNGSSWYRIWSDGWCEQGGHVSSTTGTITLLKPYIDTNYSIFMQKGTTGSNYPIVVLTQTVSNFRVDLGYGGAKSDAWWEAKGYIEV